MLSAHENAIIGRVHIGLNISRHDAELTSAHHLLFPLPWEHFTPEERDDRPVPPVAANLVSP